MPDSTNIITGCLAEFEFQINNRSFLKYENVPAWHGVCIDQKQHSWLIRNPSWIGCPVTSHTSIIDTGTGWGTQAGVIRFFLFLLLAPSTKSSARSWAILGMARRRTWHRQPQSGEAGRVAEGWERREGQAVGQRWWRASLTPEEEPGG